MKKLSDFMSESDWKECQAVVGRYDEEKLSDLDLDSLIREARLTIASIHGSEMWLGIAGEYIGAAVGSSDRREVQQGYAYLHRIETAIAKLIIQQHLGEMWNASRTEQDLWEKEDLQTLIAEGFIDEENITEMLKMQKHRQQWKKERPERPLQITTIQEEVLGEDDFMSELEGME